MERAEQADGGVRDAGGGVVREVDREEQGEREEGGAQGGRARVLGGDEALQPARQTARQAGLERLARGDREGWVLAVRGEKEMGIGRKGPG